MDLSKIQTKFRDEISISGYDLTVIKSGLQKYIRRNNVEMAMKMCMELYCFDYVENGKRILTNCLHRLQIIFLEDIGCGNIKLWKYIKDWFDQIYKEYKKNDDERNRELEIKLLKKIIFNLCKSRKIRGGSFMNSISVINETKYDKIINCCYLENFENKYTIEYLERYLEEKSWKSIVVLKKLLLLVEKKKGKEKTEMKKNILNVVSKYLDKNYLNYAESWQKDIGKLKEGYLLYFVPLCDYLYGSDELQLYEKEFTGKWDESMLGKIKLDDFVYDRHVKDPKNSSLDYFANVSSYVEPEAINVKIPEDFKIIYKWLKTDQSKTLCFGEKFPKKESELVFICRAQLVTSMGKTDTYYAKGLKNNPDQIWLVKGPFIDKNQIEVFIKLQQIKKKYGLNTVEAYSAVMEADRWPERPGLGLRHKISIDQEVYFMFCKSIIEEKDLNIIQHPGSKKWGPTDVVDLKKFSINVFKLQEEQMVQYLNLLAFRIKFNIGDWADRNFILSEEKIYSVDECVTKEKINVFNELKKNKYKYVHEKFNILKDKMHPELIQYLDNA